MAKKSFLDRLRGNDEIVSEGYQGESAPPEEKKPQAPRARQKMAAGQIALLIFLGVLLCGTVIALASVFLLKPDAVQSGSPQAVPDFAIKTAREAYPAAVELIRAEDAGAQLASAIGVWTPGTPAINIESGRTGWTFYFYLPASGEMAEVVVDRDGAATLASREPWASAPGLLDDRRWQTDSSQAMALTLERCADALRGVDDATFEARLTTALSSGQITWQVTATGGDGDTVCAATIDALTGLVR